VDVDYQLRQVSLTSKNAQPQPLLPGVSWVGSPSASADGRRIVYAARQPNGYRVVASDMATPDEKLETAVESPVFVRVVVSGDGKVIVYSDPNHVGFRMRLNQGTPEQICSSCDWPTHVNFDGSAALFDSSNEERLIRWSNGGIKPLIGGPDPKHRKQYGGRFSPNGRWVAFCAGAFDGDAREILVVPNAPDRDLREDEWISISEGETSDREPYWSPDGRRLFFISDRDGFRCIWARDVDPETGHPIGPATAIAHFHSTRELLRGPMPSPGSIGLTATAKALVFTVARSIGNLWWQRVPR
jgi:Tol biopolymer transport system component